MTPKTLKIIRQKRKLWYKYRFGRNQLKKQRYEHVKAECNMEIKVAKIQYENDLAEHIKMDNKSFWYYVRSKVGRKTLRN